MSLDDFGLPNGTPISNKDEILNDIDLALGVNDSPSVEYIFVRSFSKINLGFGYGFTFNMFGHAAVRYIDPDGNDIVVNIEGKKKNGLPMVQFYDAKEFFYGTNPNKNGEQRGVYNRNKVGVRVEKLDRKNIDKMHQYFCDLQTQDIDGDVGFNIAIGPFINFFRKFIPFQIPEYGNCSKWISEGLLIAGVVTKKTIWPKSIFINMYENCEETDTKTPDNLHVVYYEMPLHSILSYGKN